MVSQRRRIFLIGLGVVLVGFSAWEHLNRRALEGRVRAAEESRQRLEREVEELLAKHQQMLDLLEQERQRAQQLTAAMAEKSAELDQTMARLEEEARTIRELEARLAAMGQQMDQLQGELSLALERVPPDQSRRAETVQLERVFISSGSAQPGPRGRVLSFDEAWSFVVISLGWDTVSIGDTVSIFRQDQLLARARVERVQEGVAAATLLPEWQDAEIQINDVVQIL